MTRSAPRSSGPPGFTTPTPPARAERLELLEYLDQPGVALDTMVESERAGSLAALASELPLRAAGAALSVQDVAAAAATTVDRVRRVRLAAGLPADLGDRPPRAAADGGRRRGVVRGRRGAVRRDPHPVVHAGHGGGRGQDAEAAVSLFLTERMPA